jgi:hypothetical protein
MQMSSAGLPAAAPKSAPAAAHGLHGGKPSGATGRGAAAAAYNAPRSRGRFPEARSTALFEYIGASDESQQAAVLEFLQNTCQCELPMDEEGEVELDPDALSDDVLWKLDDHIKSTSGGRYNPDVLAAPVAEPVLSLAQAGLDEETDDE